ncbi:PREDICTED: replication factor C subunit 1 isoform X1 [Polistes canadensis]|uniref:replication factor C subunit 1 isoform X1 n=2 Tax=Polistes canadensis TaxID=91411 RepID=UPI000718B8B6|nr:PREDICTED: replication factor C subunit 1 isoform X1 [Polistes canadensis]
MCGIPYFLSIRSLKMPRDIRSYFTSTTVKKSKDQSTDKSADKPTIKTKKRAIISSDEEETKSSSVVKRTKYTKTFNKHHLLSDSDDEIQITSTVNSKKVESINNTKQESYVKDELKSTISPAEMFSKGSVRRETIQRKIKKKNEKEDDKLNLTKLNTKKLEKEYLQNVKEDDNEKNRTNNTIDDRAEKKTNRTSNEKKKDSVSVDDEISYRKIDTKQEDKSSGSKELSLTNEENNVDTKMKNFPKKASKRPKAISTIEIESKKAKNENALTNSSTLDEYEERIQMKKQSSMLYQKYLNRGGARNPGSKEIPQGAEYCLAGLSFVITGVLDSLEDEEAKELIIKYGGRILHQVSRNTDYLIVGEEYGPAKMAKANELKIKKISEDDLLELIRERPKGKAEDIKKSRSKSKENSISKIEHHEIPKLQKSVKETVEPVKETVEPVKETVESVKETVEPVKKTVEPLKSLETKLDSKVIANDIVITKGCEALVDKYRPKSTKQILGQQGDKSCVKKLHYWLSNWHKNRNKKYVKPSPWAKNDDGAYFRATLLSGPPGIGKTTSAQVVCNELGFDLLEFNASDTRSKKLLKERVSEILSNTTIKNFFTGENNSKHVLLMDEVDGMAGNEDRGGLQELVSLIKSTDVPIICICNDRTNPKMKTLSNYTFDLKFQKPRLEQIRATMKSICFKENIKISTEQLDQLIESTSHDIRQVINHLSLLIDKFENVEQIKYKPNKDLKLGPWEVVKKVFNVEEHKNMNINEKSDLFFHDYNIAPLFVQENYLSVMPATPKTELLERVAQAAESIALGDGIEKAIRSNNAWSLLPIQACFSSVIPGSMMSGHIQNQINFPAWLGCNSRRNKFDRLLQEITVHTRLTTGVSKEAVNLDYLNHIKDAIVRPLVNNGTEGVDEAVNVMTQYHLLREDLDSLNEVSMWPGQRNSIQAVESKVLAAFTRTYNKNSPGLPYSITTSKTKKSAMTSQEDLESIEVVEDDINSDEEEDNINLDKMIKAKKPTVKNKKETEEKSSKKPTAKRGKGNNKKSNI